jgi:hypothetical protein
MAGEKEGFLAKAAEVVKEGLGKVYDGAAHPVAHGAHELAAALFTGNGFVMYPRAGKENSDQQDNQQGKDVQAPEVQQTPEAPTQERERGGRER